MSTHIGLVRQIRENGLAEVLTDRQDACGGCHTSHDCRACLSGGGKLVSQVKNPVDAKPGDLVSIDLKSGDLLKGAALFYIFPILVLLAGAFLGASIWSTVGMTETGAAILLGLIGLAIGLGVVKWISGSEKGRDRLVPRITEIIGARGENKNNLANKNAGKRKSCCG